MAKLEILEAPHPMLRRAAAPVGAVTDEVRALTDDMLAAMYEAPGIGLAAPQVGVSSRIVVIDLARPDEEELTPLRIIDPEILWQSDTLEIAEEGCLSLPNQFADVRRPDAVRVGYTDEHGERVEIDADGLLARCLQHEIDHLDGVLFVDHLSTLKRKMIMRKLAKQQRQRD